MSGKEKLHKILLYSLTFVFMFLLQELFFANLPVFGFILLPIPCTVIALSMIESAPFGVFFGLACGLVLDVSCGTALFWYSVMLMFASYLVGRVLTNWVHQSLPSAMILSASAFILGEILRVLILHIFIDGAGLLSVFTDAIPASLLSSVTALPFILILQHIHRKHSEV
ncbi:MAG: hypothetical protein IKT60_07935 [Clostridia bacterium]|nr:hypothetical protein [Clostridia bacterium]